MKLKDLYKKEIVSKMVNKFSYPNFLQVPKLEKVVVNVGFGRYSKDKNYINNIKSNLEIITGQKSILNKAKKSISAFKIRDGMIIGAKVTLRGSRAYNFTDKVVNIVFPRVRDFRGINVKSVDRVGNLTIGFKEHVAFPEIKAEMTDVSHGLEVSFHSTSKTNEEGLEFFTLLGFPFKKNN